MSRPTDTERGARIASDIAFLKLYPPQTLLFPHKRLNAAERSFWQKIFAAAEAELAECQALREALCA